MRNPNGYGGITKLSGNRRKPFRVRVTAGWELADDMVKQKLITVGYFATRKEAMMALANYNTNPYDLTANKLTFADCYAGWSEKHFAKYPSVRKGLATAYKLCENIADIPMEHIRLKNLQDIMDTQANKSLSCQTRLKTVFSKTFRYALENDIVQKDYAQFVSVVQSGLKKGIADKFFTSDEIQAIWNNIDFVSDISFGKLKANSTKAKLVDSVLVLLYTGVRIGELLSIKCSDVDIDQRIIHLHGTKTAAANRVVPIHQSILSLIEHRLTASSEYLFEINAGEPIKDQTYRVHFFTPFMRHIHANHTPHATRHTFISLMDKCGVSAESVVLKRIVGHANSSVTEHYTHKDISELVAAIDKLKI